MTHWRLAFCPACGGAIAIETIPGSDEFVQAVPEEVGEWEVGHLPEQLARDWAEPVGVFRVGANASSVVMCGRTLEGAADILDVQGRNLTTRIQRMIENGLVSVSFSDAMDYVRLIRNTGAHAGTEVSHESAMGAMRFTQQALRLLFEVPGELQLLTGHPPELEEDAEKKPEGND